MHRLIWLFFTPKRPVRRLLSGLVVGLVIGTVMALGLWQGNFLQTIRTSLQDQLYRANPRDTKGIVTIVAIDDASLRAYGRSTVEWDRALHADLIRTLDEAGARVIVFDVLFADPTDQDAVLAAAMDESCRVVQPVAPSAGVVGVTEAHELITYAGFDRPTATLEQTCAKRRSRVALGHVAVVPDDDGVVRRMPLFVHEDETLLPALSMAAYMNYSGALMNFVQIDLDENQIDFGNPNLPTLYTDDFGRMLINFFGPPSHVGVAGSTFPVYSFTDVVEGRIDPAVFKDQIVLIGALDATALPDSYATPSVRSGEKMFGVEIHANAIETLYQALPAFHKTAKLDLGLFSLSIKQTPLPLREQPLGQQVVITFLFAVVAGMVLPFVRWYVAIGLSLVAYVIYAFVWAANIAFPMKGLVVEIVFPALALGLTFVGILINIYVFEERRRGQINDLFSRYVSAEIAQKIVEQFDHGKLELGGEEREITILFADVRGFTTLSEGLSPTEVVTLLNVFLEEMSDIVMGYGGAINKYIGDNLMAFWNAPYLQDDHAWLATRAALDMLDSIQRLNDEQKFATPVRFGIGINTGPTVVGNVGSSKRLEYTPIGDSVNVASRLCGVAGGGTCYIGQRTYDLIKDRVTPVDVHNLMLKGKTEAVTVYELHVDSVIES